MGSIIWLIVISGIIVAVLTVWTVFIFKQAENKTKHDEEEKDTVGDEMRRSEKHEKDYLRTHTPKIAWIYAILIVVTIVVIAIYANA